MRTSDVLTVVKLPEGGYVVREGGRPEMEYPALIYACTHVDELLAFLRKKLTTTE